MKNPRALSSHLLNIGTVNETQARDLSTRLSRVPGVAEAVVIAAEGVAYLKIDKQVLDFDALREFSPAEG